MTSIPHIIHRVWIGAPMPQEFQVFEDQWLDLNPGWELWHWDNDAVAGFELRNQELFDRAAEYCPERLIPRFRSNLIRYELLVRFGGVYVDCDMAPLLPLPDLSGIQAFAGWETQDRWIGNTILGSTPDHPFFESLVAGAAESANRFRGQVSPKTTGPQYLTRMWQANPAGLHVFDEQVFYPQGWRELGEQVDLTGAVTTHLWTALRGQVSVIIPYRSDNGGHRDRNLAWVRSHLNDHHPDWQVVLSADDSDGPFERARLIREGVSRSCGDVIVVMDGDVHCPDLPDAVEAVQQGARWAIPHQLCHRMTDDATVEFIATGEPVEVYDEDPYSATMTGGCVVLSRETFWRTPPDERFKGWGGEDQAWGYALETCEGPPVRFDGPMWHLWHPPQERMNRSVGNPKNERLRRQYQALRGNPVAMRQLIQGVEMLERTTTGLWVDHTGKIVDYQPEMGRLLVPAGDEVPAEVRRQFDAQIAAEEAVITTEPATKQADAAESVSKAPRSPSKPVVKRSATAPAKRPRKAAKRPTGGQ